MYFVQILPGREHGLQAIADHAGKQLFGDSPRQYWLCAPDEKTAFPTYTPVFYIGDADIFVAQTLSRNFFIVANAISPGLSRSVT